ncbi:unnamed protein product [Calypogeia fissa]
MAAVVAAAGTLASASIVSSTKAAAKSGKRAAAAARRLSLHGGLKAQNEVTAMGLSLSTEQQFANVRASYSAKSAASSKGGALASRCDVASEIFTVVPIMSALVLIGIAVGFLLLRVEAAIEESE